MIFALSVLALGYTYVGYPLFIYLKGLLFPRKVKTAEFHPTVTVLITAYNEESAIAEKLENTFQLDYPKEKLEILVASDGSDDNTDDIVKGFASKGVKLFHQPGRKGKTFTQNEAVEQSKGEIVLFSDATTHYHPDVLHKLLPNFADDDVGCVAGRLIYEDGSNSQIGKGAKSYWNYETFVKQSESRACSLIGASGCLYAVRKSAYRPMYPEACSDFLICTEIYRQGLRSVYEPDAVCYEETNKHPVEEMRMRVRVISQTFTDLWRNRDMLNPLKSGLFAVELISHKLFRYAVPVFLFFSLISAFLLAFRSGLFLLVFGIQLGFYLLAAVSWILDKRKIRIKFLAFPLYFVLTNIASIKGFYKFLRGERYAAWEPIRSRDEKRVSTFDQTT